MSVPAKLRAGTELALGYPGANLDRGECAALLAAIEALREMVELEEETDAYPTSDGHPLYAARAALTALGR